VSDDFRTTRWSIVRAAQSSHANRERALAWLCEAYWLPLYAFVRRRGVGADDARDLVQSFFAALLERDAIAKVRPEAGKFRAFLLASMKNFLANERARDAAEKRRAANPAFTVTLDDAEDAYAREASRDLDAEQVFERRWALNVVSRATARLRQEYVASGRSELFEALQPHLSGDADLSHAQTAAALAMSEGAVKTAVHRLRKRLGQALRHEVGETVSDPDQIDDELRALLRILA
jgi:RNA polymerase sigma-70 factor (ECF subfamily)